MHRITLHLEVVVPGDSPIFVEKLASVLERRAADALDCDMIALATRARVAELKVPMSGAADPARFAGYVAEREVGMMPEPVEADLPDEVRAATCSTGECG